MAIVSKSKSTTSSTNIIVVGNEKGGSGKSTTTMHLAIALLREGWRVGTIDLDGQQATLTRYLQNRVNYLEHHGQKLPVPEHFSIAQAQSDIVSNNRDAEIEALKNALERLEEKCEIIIIDTPGSDTNLMCMSHMLADTLITPVNDSFLDLDVIGTIDGETRELLIKGSYAQMVYNCRERQMDRHGHQFDWIVMRNRLSFLQAHNKHHVRNALEGLAQELDFTPVEGLHERVIFKELFPLGLTILDTVDQCPEAKLSMSHIAARQELRALVNLLKLSKPAARAKKQRGMRKKKNAWTTCSLNDAL